MQCPLDLLAWHNDQWLAMTVHDAKLTSLNPKGVALLVIFAGFIFALGFFHSLGSM